MNFKQLQQFYSDNFSLGYINASGRSSIENRFVLISLICYVTFKYKLKDPDTTYYGIITKLNKDIHLPEDFIKGLAIVCEDFAYQCQDFPVFGLKGNEIVKEIKNILSTYLPF